MVGQGLGHRVILIIMAIGFSLVQGRALGFGISCVVSSRKNGRASSKYASMPRCTAMSATIPESYSLEPFLNPRGWNVCDPPGGYHVTARRRRDKEGQEDPPPRHVTPLTVSQALWT